MKNSLFEKKRKIFIWRNQWKAFNKAFICNFSFYQHKQQKQAIPYEFRFIQENHSKLNSSTFCHDNPKKLKHKNDTKPAQQPKLQALLSKLSEISY